MQNARDEVYCHLVARRAVARASLHLGMKEMSAETLDVLADCLLSYIQRIGQAAAFATEASGRSSAHVNVLDAIRAVETCTTSAVERVHAEQTQQGSKANWKGLAEFLFGPDWHLEETAGRVDPSEEQPVATGNSGKVGPSSTAGNNLDTDANTSKGWEAPYPEEIPVFPVAADHVANPHPLTSSEALDSLHSIVITIPEAKDTKDTKQNTPASPSTTKMQPTSPVKMEESPKATGISTSPKNSPKNSPKPATSPKQEARKTEVESKETVSDMPPLDLPKSLWGSMALDGTQNKRKRENDQDETSAEPTAKKVRLTEPDKEETEAMDQDDEEEDSLHMPILPDFYPPLPRAADAPRTLRDSVVPPVAERAPPAVSSSRPSAAVASLASVRSALVANTYWGSYKDDDGTAEPPVKVPAGPTEATVQSHIVPLGRASGSRVSRILEGSMDVPTL